MKITITIDTDTGAVTAWHPTGIAAAYDVPPQTVREILDEYDRDWAGEPVPEYEGPLSPGRCGTGCEYCDLDWPGE